jgi:hypothetical protein
MRGKARTNTVYALLYNTRWDWLEWESRKQPEPIAESLQRVNSITKAPRTVNQFGLGEKQGWKYKLIYEISVGMSI